MLSLRIKKGCPGVCGISISFSGILLFPQTGFLRALDLMLIPPLAAPCHVGASQSVEWWLKYFVSRLISSPLPGASPLCGADPCAAPQELSPGFAGSYKNLPFQYLEAKVFCSEQESFLRLHVFNESFRLRTCRRLVTVLYHLVSYWSELV